MTGREDELEAFKTIDLRAYAADAHSYVLDAKASGPSSALMRGPGGDKIVIAVDRRDSHFVYFSVGDPSDSGSIIDFAQKRGVGSLGQVRKALRLYIGESPPPRSITFPSALQPIARDIVGVRARFEAMQPLDEGRHHYLTEVRRIPAELLAHPRFASRVRTDERSNSVWPHFNKSGLVGFEIKNDGFTGFAKGGEKGLWASGVDARDRSLVIAESAIDALSYAAIFGHDLVRFISLAGQVSPEQVELARAAIEKLPGEPESRGDVVLAFDNDAAGDALVAKFSNVFEAVGRQDRLTLRVVRPETRGMDWNRVLQERTRPSPPPPEADTPSAG